MTGSRGGRLGATCHGARRALAGETGMITAEAAVVLPVLLVVAGAGLAGLSVGVDQIRCVDAARVGARSAARGDGPGVATSVAARSAPAGSSVTVAVSGPEVTVTVGVTRSVLGLGAFEVTASATAPVEDPP